MCHTRFYSLRSLKMRSATVFTQTVCFARGKKPPIRTIRQTVLLLVRTDEMAHLISYSRETFWLFSLCRCAHGALANQLIVVVLRALFVFIFSYIGLRSTFPRAYHRYHFSLLHRHRHRRRCRFDVSARSENPNSKNVECAELVFADLKVN